MEMNLDEAWRVYVVMNPVSGTLNPETVRERIEFKLGEHGVPFTFYETTGKEDLQYVVRKAVEAGFNLFLAVGGDGTIAAVAGGLVGTQIPLAVVPTGTWNGLARSLDIPIPIDDALELVFQRCKVHSIDAMQVDHAFSLLNVDAGIGSLTMTDVRREHKRRFGKLYDLWHVFVQLIGLHSFSFDVIIDGNLTRFRAAEVMVANCRNIALKSIELDPEIRMDDGKMNVCRIRADNLLDYLSIGVSMLTGKQRQNRNVLCLDALHEVEIHSKEDLPFQADGDIVGRLPVKIRLYPHAVHILIPADADV